MKKILYPLLLSAFVLASCNEWLDVKPQTEVDIHEMFTKEKHFKDALTACYIKLNSPNLYGKRLTMTDVEYLAQHWRISISDTATLVNKLKNFEYTSDYARTALSAIYGGLYNVISQANIVLENIETRGDVVKTAGLREMITAEALAIRAFCHLDILRLFGQMPQGGTKSVQLPYAKTVSTAAIPYYSFDAFKDLILADIDAAEVLLREHDPLLDYSFAELDYFSDPAKSSAELDDTFFGYRRFRFNYYALHALKARLYLYVGDRDNAYSAAKTVINAKDADGSLKLRLAGTDDFNRRSFTLPSECILALSNFEISKTIERLFDPNDGLYVLPADLSNGIFAGQDQGTNNRALYVWNRATTSSQGAERPVIRKYDQPAATDYVSSNDLAVLRQVIPLIRLSEMYLIAMETAGTLTEANALYRDYMLARNVPVADLTQAGLQTELLREYRREFFAEGQMFYTYKRLGTETLLWKTDRTVGENDYIAPLPQSEVNAGK